MRNRPQFLSSQRLIRSPIIAALILAAGALMFVSNSLADSSSNNQVAKQQKDSPQVGGQPTRTNPITESGENTLSQAELEQLLAPIALYPDTILTHILIAATYPLEVIQAERWLAAHPDTRGIEAVNSVQDQDWDPSVQALLAFPQILERMSQDINWTQTLGEAFLDNEARVLASVQTLRQLAKDSGSLAQMDKVNVSNDQDSIVIESIEREVVYIPYYDTRQVYGRWRWAHYDPVFWDYPYQDRYYGRRYPSSFFWGPRVSVSFGFFFNTLHWHNRHVVRIPDRYYRNHQYYGYRDLVGHRYGQRWVHNANHRRGVVYRNHRLREDYSRHERQRDNRYQRNDREERQQQVRQRLDSYQGDGLQRFRQQRQRDQNQAATTRSSSQQTRLQPQVAPSRPRTTSVPTYTSNNRVRQQQTTIERSQERIRSANNNQYYRAIPDRPSRPVSQPRHVSPAPRSTTSSSTSSRTYTPAPRQAPAPAPARSEPTQSKPSPRPAVKNHRIKQANTANRQHRTNPR